MGQYYPNTVVQTLIGTKVNTTRTGVTLESTYQTESTIVATKTFETSGYSRANFDILYTMGATETANSIEVMLEGSPDRTNFYRLANDTTVAGTSTLAAREFTFVGTNAAAATVSIVMDISYKFMRISVKETGVAANKGTLFAEVTLAGK